MKGNYKKNFKILNIIFSFFFFFRRVIPFADEQLGNEARPFVLVNGRILARPAAGGYTKQQRAAAAPEPTRKAPSPRGAASKRRKREKTPTRPASVSLGRNGGGQFLPAVAVPAAPSASVSKVAEPPLKKAAVLPVAVGVAVVEAALHAEDLLPLPAPVKNTTAAGVPTVMKLHNDLLFTFYDLWVPPPQMSPFSDLLYEMKLEK